MTYYRNQSFRQGPFGGLLDGLPPMVRALLIANVGVYVTHGVLALFYNPAWNSGHYILGFTPELLWKWGAVWQPLTYQFLHGSPLHLAFNMLALWIFGSQLERLWGGRVFLRYYLISGVGGAVLYLLVGFLPSQPLDIPMVGASGAIFGLLLAYGLLFPNRTIHLLFPPIALRARVLVTIFGVLALLSAVTPGRSGVAHFAHLGGLAAGYLQLRGLSGLRRWLLGTKKQARRRRFRVVKDDDNGDSRAQGPYDVH
jgi:membrane associated rhomboid family serine protease